MRILHVGKYYPPVHGGMERFLGDLVQAQLRAGDDVLVLVHEDRRNEGVVDPDWVWRCPVWLRLIFAPISPAFLFWLRRAINRFQPDVIHLHMPNPSAFWALLLPSARRIPWVVHWHSDVVPSRHRLALRLAYPHYRLFERALLEHADAIVATSPTYLAASETLRPWIGKCHVVPLGADMGRLPDVESGAGDRLWSDKKLRILAIGRLSYYKGFETLIKAIAGLPGVELIIVGEGQERARLEKRVAKLGLAAHVRLPGALDDSTCLRLLASCDVFCLPSRERTEAFGIVLMEAMRYGKPVYAGNLPGSGVNWVVRNGIDGRLIPPEEPADWHRALSDLIADPDSGRLMGEQGRRRFFSEMAIERVETGLKALYGALLPDEYVWPERRAQPLVVIPALDEAESIGTVVAEVRGRGYGDVLVVDDGSQDDTARIALAQGAKVLRAPLPQGAWGAMQTGIRYAIHHGYPGVVTMDADGQHEPAYLDDLLTAGREYDVVIGACPQRGSRLRQIAWGYFRFLTGFAFEDLTSGFRYYNAKACRVLADEEATLLDYQDIGVLLLLHKAGFRVSEIPVSMNPRRNGVSRVFFSWWAVTRYMAETTLLCLARWNTKTRRI